MEDPEPQHLLHDEDSRSTRIMAKLKDSLLSQFAEFNPSLSITPHHASFIERRLQQLFTSFHTPTHPPYALMIRRAIMELNEGNGSTEEAISEFIRREYNDLPWAHVRILGVHLRKLCHDGELVCTEGKKYMLLVDDGKMGGDGEERECKGSKKRGKKRSNHGNGERKGTMDSWEGVERGNQLQEEGIEEKIQVSELDGARTDEPRRVVDRQCEWTQEHGEAHEQSIERVEELVESEKGRIEVVGKQSQSQWQGTGIIFRAQSEVEESQIQDSVLHLETICSSQPTALNLPVDSHQPLLVPISEGLPKCIPSAGIELSLTQLQLQLSSHGPSESSFGAAAKMSASLSSLDFHEHKQDEHPMSGDAEEEPPKHQCRGRPSKSKLVADYQGESLLYSGDPIVIEPKPNVNKIEKRWMSQPQGRGIGRGRRRKLHRNAHHFKEQIRPQDQAQGLLSSPYSVQKETIYSSQPTAQNFPVNITLNSGQQSVVPISEGSPECIISPGNKLSPTQLQLQISSDVDLGTTSKMEASLSYVNVHDKQQQHCNQGSPNGNLEENPMSEDPEQKPPKRPRGRPPKLKTVANYPGESLLPSDDGILIKQKPNTNKMEKQHQYGRGRGRGKGRGRPRRLSQNANQCEEQLQPQDQAQGLVSSPAGDDNQSLGQKQLQVHSQGRRPEQELDIDESFQKQQLLPQVRSRDRGRRTKAGTHVKQSQWQQLQTCQGLCVESALNSLSDAFQSLQQLQPQLLEVEGHQQGQGWDQNQDLGQERPPNPMLDANQSHQLLLQPQACEVQGRRWGRPPKQNQKLNESLQQLGLQERQCRDRGS